MYTHILLFLQVERAVYVQNTKRLTRRARSIAALSTVLCPGQRARGHLRRDVGGGRACTPIANKGPMRTGQWRISETAASAGHRRSLHAGSHSPEFEARRRSIRQQRSRFRGTTTRRAQGLRRPLWNEALARYRKPAHPLDDQGPVMTYLAVSSAAMLTVCVAGIITLSVCAIAEKFKP